MPNRRNFLQQSAAVLNTLGQGVCIVDITGRLMWQNRIMASFGPAVLEQVCHVGHAPATDAMPCLYDGPLGDEPGMYATLEEGPHNLWWNMQRFKWNFLPLQNENKIQIVKFDPNPKGGGDIAEQVSRIVQKARDGSEVRRWRINNAWPKVYVPGEWDNEGNANVIEKLTLAIDSYELEE